MGRWFRLSFAGLFLALGSGSITADSSTADSSDSSTPGSSVIDSGSVTEHLAVGDSDDSIALENDPVAGDTPVEEGEPLEQGPTDIEGLNTDIARYASEIKRLEGDFGAYEQGISEELTGLGLLYQRAGMHKEAVDTFKRAIHVNRINEGLYNFSEIPILEEMIESYAALGEWEEVNNRYHFLFRVHNRNYGRTDPRVLPALEKLSNWHLQAYSEEFSGRPLNHLLTARNLYDSSVRIIAVNFGATDPRLAEPLRKRTMVDYYLATHGPQGSGAGSAAGNISAYRSSTNDAALASYMLNSYTIGKRALGTIRDIYSQSEDASLTDQVASIVELGDWHMLYDRRQSALRTYKEALQLIQENGGNEVAHQAFFGRPTVLPAAGIFTGSELAVEKPKDEIEGFVVVRFSVDKGGRARDLELVESSPPDKKALDSKLRKRIRTTRFRPRFEDGQPVKTENVNLRYVFSYLPEE